MACFIFKLRIFLLNRNNCFKNILGVNQEHSYRPFDEKTEGQKSRDTVLLTRPTYFFGQDPGPGRIARTPLSLMSIQKLLENWTEGRKPHAERKERMADRERRGFINYILSLKLKF